MIENLRAKSSRCAILVVLFLWAACNENLKQNTDSKNQNPDSSNANSPQNSQKIPADLAKKPSDDAAVPYGSREPFYVADLGSSDSPTLLYGSSPRFLKLTSDGSMWRGDLHPENVDQYTPNYYPIDDQGLVLVRNDANDYGLYFGSYPHKAKITVCNETSCKITPISRQDFVVIHSSGEKFDQLYEDAQDVDPSSIAISEWNLYFFKPDLSSLEDTKNATLEITQINGVNSAVFDWNNLAGKTGTTTFGNGESDVPILKTIQFDHKPILVGKYKSSSKEYKMIGIEQQTIVN